MWVDDSGATDTTGTTAGSDEMAVSVEGEEYVAEINFDIDEDGVEDTAIIEHANGSGQAFVDSDGDGAADEYIQLDAEGNVVAHAEYDEASGDWLSVEPGGTDSGDTQTSSAGPMTADLPSGETEIGPATVDTNDDGINDTAVVADDAGNTTAFTDLDGDGEADVAVIIDHNGDSTTYEHTGDGEWTEIGASSNAVGNTGVAAGATADAAWGADGHDGAGSVDQVNRVEGVARIDSATGQWISQN